MLKNKYSCVGLLHLRIEQPLRKIQFIHKLLLHPVHRSLTISIIDILQLSTGISTPVLSTTNHPMSHISSTWMIELINFLQTYQIRIIIPNLLSFVLQRINDKKYNGRDYPNKIKIKSTKKNKYLQDVSEYHPP